MTLLLLLLEAGVALALLFGIVWWTWPRASNDAVKPRVHDAANNRAGDAAPGSRDEQ